VGNINILSAFNFVVLLFKKLFSFVFNKKTFNLVMSFLMIVSLAYVTIEKIDPEPALATGNFDCVTSEGRAYLYQSTWSGSTLTINRGYLNDSGNFIVQNGYQAFTSWSQGSISEVNSLSVTSDGEMYAILKRTNTNTLYFYELEGTGSSGGTGTASYKSGVNIGSGDNNAATNYETTVGGTTYKYIFTSKGFFNGNNKAIRIDGSNNFHVIDLTVNNSSNGSNKAKDIAWVSNSGSGGSYGADFIGYTGKDGNDLLGATITSHTNHGNSNEAITINLSVLDGSAGSGSPSQMSSNSGAAMSVGNGDVLFLENNSGDLWLYDESADTLTETSYEFSSSSNTDGAGCGTGIFSGNDEFAPTVTAAQGTCSGSNKTVAVTLNNSGSDIAANYVVTYTISGSTSNLTTGTSVNGGASNTSLSVPAQANGTSVQLNWYAENTSYGLRTPASSTSSVNITVDTSELWSSAPYSYSFSKLRILFYRWWYTNLNIIYCK